MVWCVVLYMLEVDASLAVVNEHFVEDYYNAAPKLLLTLVNGYFVDDDYNAMEEEAFYSFH